LDNKIPVGTWKVRFVNKQELIASAINMEITPRIGTNILSPPQKK